MPPSSPEKLTNLTSVSLTTLEDCSDESIFAPGYIQPHGIILTLQEPDLTIVQTSANVAQFFGIAAEDLLGKPLQHLFSDDQVAQVATFLEQDPLGFCNPFELSTQQTPTQTDLPQQAQRFRGTLYRTTDALILELEPLSTAQNDCILQTYHHLQMVILELRRASSLLDLAQILAREVKTITGFDRVMIYRFEGDDSGVVIAEEKETHLESYLGLHYPAIDIPRPVRQLFHRNWVRLIPNINCPPVPLIPTNNPLTDTPLDLRDSFLRGIAPAHVEYLQNMGVAGSFVISLIADRRLWGLIACHHYSPRLLSAEIRRTCEFIGQFASIELVRQEERALSAYRTQVKTIQNEFQQAFLQDLSFIDQVLTRNPDQLLDLVHAHGAAILLDNTLTLLGQTPSEQEVLDLVAWLKQHQASQLRDKRVFATHSLPRIYPSAMQFKDQASGVLAISILLNQTKQKSYHILWFRPEQVHTVNWAGKPTDSITIDEIGQLKLSPRKSFELWKETVRETSAPWLAAELEAAVEMRNTLMLAVLEFSQVALEKAAERAMLANRAKSQFLAKMSHELRTPLNAILGFTQVITRNPNTPQELHEHLNIINRSGEHLLTMINDVLEMSRIEAGQIVLNEHDFNLHYLLQGLRELFALKAAQKGLTLAFEQDPNLPRYPWGDEGKLRQILINLINNAIKFTAKGGVTVRAWVDTGTPSDPAAFILVFTVEDTGCGIDVAHWESIFEAFMQTEQGRHADGTGLGLSISRQFAQLMGGDITVHSTPNEGSTFTGRVVLHHPPTTDLLEPEIAPVITGLEPGQPTYRLLVVEDVLENRQLLTTLLEPIGFEVLTAENGEAAIVQWQSHHPHLILMDIQMPVMDGYEATRQIRSQESLVTGHSSLEESTDQPPTANDKPQTTNDKGLMTNDKPQMTNDKTKIIALTAHAFESDRATSLEAGCDDYLTKPFTETALFEIIAQHLGVHYIYASSSLSKGPVSSKLLTPDNLSMMSLDWKHRVYEAALDLQEETLRQLIAEIPQKQTALIEGMTYLVDNFQLETIATLTQP